ncbi:hypothetical protein [Streptomyces sp. NPDC023588]|uniref:hypothetical protein n=1 Tax=Streptomyces sp. NPDC023588 TaxID=3154907 RepID=UPI0033CF5A72
MPGFGVVVEADGIQAGFGDAFGAVLNGGDGGLPDESGEASDAAGGALVEVGRVAGERSGLVSPSPDFRLARGDGRIGRAHDAR